jgi:hypothetical protein
MKFTGAMPRLQALLGLKLRALPRTGATLIDH